MHGAWSHELLLNFYARRGGQPRLYEHKVPFEVCEGLGGLGFIGVCRG